MAKLKNVETGIDYETIDECNCCKLKKPTEGIVLKLKWLFINFEYKICQKCVSKWFRGFTKNK